MAIISDGQYWAQCVRKRRGEHTNPDSGMHNRLREHLKAASRKTANGRPDFKQLLRLISDFYRDLEAARGSAEAAVEVLGQKYDELARQVDERDAGQVQAVLDNVKDSILTVDPAGVIESVNTAGQRVFGYSESELAGRSLSAVIPDAGAQELSAYLEHMAARLDDTYVDLAPQQTRGRRKNSELFPAEIAISKTCLGPRRIYIVSLHDISERKQAEEALRDSEGRFRTLIDNAPDAIVVLDVDEGRFVDANENAVRFFDMSREQLLKVGPEEVSPPFQEDGTPSFGVARGYIEQVLAGASPVFEWLHTDSKGRVAPCEVRLARLPSSKRKLIRGSIIDISERKRSELVASEEKAVLEMVAQRAPLSETFRVICNAVEAVCAKSCAAIQLLEKDGKTLRHESARNVPDAYTAQMDSDGPECGYGSISTALTERALIFAANIADDERWKRRRQLALENGLRACWTAPVRASKGHLLGALSVYHREPASPGTAEIEFMQRMAQLSGIAVEGIASEQALRESESRYRGLFENVVDGVYRSTPEGAIVAANPALVSMLGFDSVEQLTSVSNAADLYANPADRTNITRKLEQAGVVHNHEYRLRRRDGREIVVLENARAVCDVSGEVVAFEGTITDITERKRAELAVFEEKERAQVTLESIGDAVVTTDAEGVVDYLNPVAEALTGWSRHDATGRSVSEVARFIDERSGEIVENPVERCLREGRAMAMTPATTLLHCKGKKISIQDSAAPIRDRDGNIVGAVLVFHDVSKERRLHRKLSYQATHDLLTGLINRREFENRLIDALESVRRGSDRTHVLLYLDLDQFKLVNDTCGHIAGDELLKQLAAIMRERIRATDVLARLGGDEFGILLENCSADKAVGIADDLREAIRDFRFPWQGASYDVAASIGLITITAASESVASILSAADVACYAAKDLGRNRIHVYQEGAAPERHKEMRWVSRITRAVEENRLELYFQPIVPIGNNPDRRGHYELLLRMLDEEGQLVLPDVFIPAAERYNLMPVIDRWVVQAALDNFVCHQISDDSAEGYSIAINLSGTSLNDARFLDFVRGQIKGHDLAPGAICFEITETAAIANLGNVVRFMIELRKLGCAFSLDDFGSGLSSFTYLKNLPVDFIKIDGHFIKNVIDDAIDQSMVEAICQVGQAMGIRTIAERVESGEVLARLAEIGVQYAQGYHIARPQPVSSFPRFGQRGARPTLKLA